MPRNGSGTMTPDVDFTTEASSPPIEISKLDQCLEDMADELTNSLAADGQTNPTANIKLNGFRLINLGAATALTDAPRVTEIIDQDHIYYVDSGSANTYAITPSPAIAAYEEGQRFVVRLANASTSASTLNVNGLGAIAIQHPDGSVIASGDLAAGGIFEFTYDANTTPDRWVLTSPGAQIADGMLSSNVPLINALNAFTGAVSGITAPLKMTSTVPGIIFDQSNAAANNRFWRFLAVSEGLSFTATNDTASGETTWLQVERTGTTVDSVALAATTISVTGALSTPNTNASEVGFKGTPQNVQNGDYTLVLTDAGKSIDKQSGGAGETITIPANASVAFPVGTVICGDNDGGGTLTIAITSDTLEDTLGNTGSRTVADNGQWHIKKISSTKWRITGAGIS